VHGLLSSNSRRSLSTQARKTRQGGTRGQRSRWRQTVCRYCCGRGHRAGQLGGDGCSALHCHHGLWSRRNGGLSLLGKRRRSGTGASVYRGHIFGHGIAHGGDKGPALVGELVLLLAGQLMVGVCLGPKLLKEVHDVV
jgi:hypothetical protein